MDIFLKKSFEKTSVVHCGVQLKTVLAFLEDWKGNVKGSLLPCYNPSEGQHLDRIKRQQVELMQSIEIAIQDMSRVVMDTNGYKITQGESE